MTSDKKKEITFYKFRLKYWGKTLTKKMSANNYVIIINSCNFWDFNVHVSI